MESSQNSGSLMGFTDNILILNNENRVSCIGKTISDMILPSGLDIKKDLFAQITSDQGRLQLEKAVDTVRKNHSIYTFEIPGIDIEFAAFPCNVNTDWVIIASQKLSAKEGAIRHQLHERVKELECLYSISHEMKSSEDLDETIEMCMQHLIAGSQYPDITTVRVELKPDKYYGNIEADKKDYSHFIEVPIMVNKKEMGKIIVFHEQPAEFLNEEYALLKEISFIFANRLERLEYVQKLEKNRKILMKKNKKLLELAEDCGIARKKLQGVLNAITDKLVVINSDFIITRSNKDSIKTGEKCHQEIFSSSKRCENCPAELAFNESAPAVAEVKFEDNYYVLRAYPIVNDNGDVERVVETCSDVTQQKQMEAQLFQSYKLASIGKLVAGIGHEINNPNTFIRGNVKIIREAFQDIFPLLDNIAENQENLRLARLDYKVFREHIPQLIEDMDHGTERINNIVLGLRNFCKKNDGVFTEDVDLNDLIKNNLNIVKKEISKTACLKEHLEEKLPSFKGNRQKIEQVLMNLLTNSSQAVSGNNSLITISTNYDRSTESVVLHIKDNGTGMDEKTKKHIFDPFFTTKRNKGGTGLGLSILYGIIKDHHGTIDVESCPGKGTLFTIHFPLIKGGIQ